MTKKYTNKYNSLQKESISSMLLVQTFHLLLSPFVCNIPNLHIQVSSFTTLYKGCLTPHFTSPKSQKNSLLLLFSSITTHVSLLISKYPSYFFFKATALSREKQSEKFAGTTKIVIKI